MRDMTKGNIAGHIAIFSVPLALANVFQLLYGVVNSIIAGRLLGREALAAVGTSIPLMNIATFLIVGVTMGASVLIAEYFGAKDEEKLKDEVATALTAGLIFTICLSCAGILLARFALLLIKAPPEIVPQALSYLKIIFAGLLFLFLYNCLASAMRAVGESAAPLCFLICSSLLNMLLAVFFVKALNFGVAGEAVATVISWAFSALLCVIYIRFKMPVLRGGGKFLRIKISLLKKTLAYGAVSGVQQTVLYAGIFLLQGAVNALGIDAIAAYNAVSQIDTLVMTVSDSIASALMMFASQNRGANDESRVRSGLRVSFLISLAGTSLCAALLYVAPLRLVSAFIDKGETAALSMGASYLKFIAPFYLIGPFCNTFQGFFRGVGRLDVTLYATIVQIPVRVAVAYAAAASLGMECVAVGIAVGWVCMLAYHVFEYGRYKTRFGATKREDLRAIRI